MRSIWEKTNNKPCFEVLTRDIKTDVLIIGGGISGVLCAYMLEKAGVNYALVEAKELCSGITKDTTAKITLQHGLIYDRLIRNFGLEAAELYLDANQNALNKYNEMCQNIDCDYRKENAYVYSLRSRKKIEREVRAYERLGYPSKFVSELAIPLSVAGAVCVKEQAQFHPLKFIYSVANGLNIYENTKILELKPGVAITNRGSIKAKKIIVATHFPFLNKHGSYFIKLYQHRSYVLGIKNVAKVDGMYVDENEKGLSFRSYKDTLLLGGGGNRTGVKGGNWKELTAFAEKNYQGFLEEYRWATQDCMSIDGMPYIGQYSKKTNNLFVATGFNKWGMSSAMVAAEILTDLVQEKSNPYASLFLPSRSMLHPQILINTAETLLNLLTPTVPRCPHMGCALKYNKQEHSWDCPCHGSRFDQNGQLIDNPATKDRKR